MGTVGEILAAGTNPFVGSWLGGGTVSSLELTVVRWIAEAVGYDPTAAGLFTSGGSMANLSALAAARQRSGAATRDDVLYFSEQGHESAEKAARILGYDGSCIRRVAVDEHFRLDVDALEAAISQDRKRGRRPIVVCANAGTTNTGAVDPLTEIAGVCQREGLWFHVDAAYGGFAAISEEGRRRLEGMPLADSLTLDPHKWLYAPMGTGCVLVKDRESLEGAFRAEADYLKDVPRDEVNFFDWSPELSRPARVLGVWTLIRAVGIDALAVQIDADLELAALAERLLAEVEGLEIVVPTQLSVVAFRNRRREGESEHDRAARDTALMEDTLAEGEVMISTTLLGGVSALRFVVQNHRTTEEELRRSVAAIAASVRRLTGSCSTASR
jgi:glutamate/tyrosine decarboxylase-like PLP-dependent enzyme